MSIAVTSELKPTNQDICPRPDTIDLDRNSCLLEIPKMKSPLIPEPTEVEPVTPNPVNMDEIPLPKKTYSFEPETKQLQDEADAGSQTQGRKTETDNNLRPLGTEPGCDVDDVTLPENSDSSEQRSEFQDNNREKKSPSQKRGNKPVSKLASKKQKPKTTVGENDMHTTPNVDDIPLPKTSYNFDPSQWDDPNFDPFGGKNKTRNFPTLQKESYDFNPDNFDDSLDAFKPSSKIIGSGDSEGINYEKTMEEQNKECPLVEEKKVRQSAKKSKEKIIT